MTCGADRPRRVRSMGCSWLDESAERCRHGSPTVVSPQQSDSVGPLLQQRSQHWAERSDRARASWWSWPCGGYEPRGSACDVPAPSRAGTKVARWRGDEDRSASQTVTTRVSAKDPYLIKSMTVSPQRHVGYGKSQLMDSNTVVHTELEDGDGRWDREVAALKARLEERRTFRHPNQGSSPKSKQVVCDSRVSVDDGKEADVISQNMSEVNQQSSLNKQHVVRIQDGEGGTAGAVRHMDVPQHTGLVGSHVSGHRRSQSEDCAEDVRATSSIDANTFPLQEWSCAVLATRDIMDNRAEGNLPHSTNLQVEECQCVWPGDAPFAWVGNNAACAGKWTDNADKRDCGDD